jgi:hypothetical protein
MVTFQYEVLALIPKYSVSDPKSSIRQELFSAKPAPFKKFCMHGHDCTRSFGVHSSATLLVTEGLVLRWPFKFLGLQRW